MVPHLFLFFFVFSLFCLFVCLFVCFCFVVVVVVLSINIFPLYIYIVSHLVWRSEINIFLSYIYNVKRAFPNTIHRVNELSTFKMKFIEVVSICIGENTFFSFTTSLAAK